MRDAVVLMSAPRRRILVGQAGDGLFTFREEELLVYDVEDVGEVPIDWKVVRHGGLYSTRDEAESAARQDTVWPA